MVSQSNVIITVLIVTIFVPKMVGDIRGMRQLFNRVSVPVRGVFQRAMGCEVTPVLAGVITGRIVGGHTTTIDEITGFNPVIGGDHI